MGKRIAVIDRDKCTNKRCGYVCQSICPGVRMGDDTITIDDKGFPVINEDLCTGCGICPKRCPAGAIKIINLAGEGGDPLIQYGVNSFRLYNFAVPKNEGVVAIVGKNGIGKSTLLDVLSGKLIPNFFDFSKTYTLEEIIPEIKNLELRNYFEKLKDKEIKVSYKIQNVELLQKVASEKTVIEVLTQFDEIKSKEKVIEILKLTKILDSKLSELSGGELQKVAIAVASLKDSNLYFFDEPSTYLDIYERMKMAQYISSLSDKSSVFVVEHDLAILDYLADYVYVLYGEPGAYGVVSKIKGARVGINEFMEGYLKDENVRFRDVEIKFNKFSVGEQNKKILLSYPAFKKDFGRFSFHSEPGDVKKGEVVGIIGPNAIGKSTFVKLLAGVIESDEGEISNLKVAYKPQYIQIDFDGTVQDYIMQEKISAIYIKEFDLESLLFKKLERLSGGELQRLAIAHALSRDADIYLLDEPSAFLDVEQRMRIANVISRDISNKEKVAFIVDHDIVFIDTVSNRLINFTGDPSIHGEASTLLEKHKAMNLFLKGLDITLRRDQDTFRPKINKPDSVLDREQREKNNYYSY